MESTEIRCYAIVDALQSRAAVVTSTPTWAAGVRRWREYATTLLDNLDADGPTLVAGSDIAGGMADVGAGACDVENHPSNNRIPYCRHRVVISSLCTQGFKNAYDFSIRNALKRQ